MKKCIFTINFGKHDRLREPLKVTEGWDYICFTNNDITSGVWEIRKITSELSNPLAARKVYINSQKYLPEYDYSIMIGGQIEIKDDLNELVKNHFNLESDFNLMRHPCRNDIYEEAAVVIKEHIATPESVNSQIERYRKEGMPENFGLSACGIIGRNHNANVAFCEERWWNEVLRGSHRDQLSFDYVRWRYPICTYHWFFIGYWELLHGKYFDIYRHNSENFA